MPVKSNGIQDTKVSSEASTLPQADSSTSESQASSGGFLNNLWSFARSYSSQKADEIRKQIKIKKLDAKRADMITRGVIPEREARQKTASQQKETPDSSPGSGQEPTQDSSSAASQSAGSSATSSSASSEEPSASRKSASPSSSSDELSEKNSGQSASPEDSQESAYRDQSLRYEDQIRKIRDELNRDKKRKSPAQEHNAERLKEDFAKMRNDFMRVPRREKYKHLHNKSRRVFFKTALEADAVNAPMKFYKEVGATDPKAIRQVTAGPDPNTFFGKLYNRNINYLKRDYRNNLRKKAFSPAHAQAYALIDMTEEALKANNVTQRIHDYEHNHPLSKFKVETLPNGRRYPWGMDQTAARMEMIGRKGYSYKGAEAKLLHDSFMKFNQNPKSNQAAKQMKSDLNYFHIAPNRYQDKYLDPDRLASRDAKYSQEAGKSSHPRIYKEVAKSSLAYQLKWNDSPQQSIYAIKYDLDHSKDSRELHDTYDPALTEFSENRQKENFRRWAARRAKHTAPEKITADGKQDKPHQDSKDYDHQHKYDHDENSYKNRTSGNESANNYSGHENTFNKNSERGYNKQPNNSESDSESPQTSSPDHQQSSEPDSQDSAVSDDSDITIIPSDGGLDV